jgi:cell filamentation protein
VSYAAEPDPLCYPGTSVLINLLDITNPQLLEEAEVVLFVVRAEEPPDGGFDLDHYLELHRHLFQDIYSWAGQIRTIRIGKDGIGSVTPSTSRVSFGVSSPNLENPMSSRE